jgi:hypothetical protein
VVNGYHEGTKDHEEHERLLVIKILRDLRVLRAFVINRAGLFRPKQELQHQRAVNAKANK